MGGNFLDLIDCESSGLVFGHGLGNDANELVQRLIAREVVRILLASFSARAVARGTLLTIDLLTRSARLCANCRAGADCQNYDRPNKEVRAQRASHGLPDE